MQQETWNCRKCDTVIDGHNYYCHDGMCDDCFFKKHFPKDQAAYEERIIKIGEKTIDPNGLEQEDFEKEFGLTEYIETKHGKADKEYTDAFFAFLERQEVAELTAYKLYEEEVVELLKLSFDEIKINLYLLNQKKGVFFDEDYYISQAFTDKKTFFAIVQRGVIFFSGNGVSSKIMQQTLNEFGIKFFLEEVAKYNELERI